MERFVVVWVLSFLFLPGISEASFLEEARSNDGRFSVPLLEGWKDLKVARESKFANRRRMVLEIAKGDDFFKVEEAFADNTHNEQIVWSAYPVMHALGAAGYAWLWGSLFDTRGGGYGTMHAFKSGKGEVLYLGYFKSGRWDYFWSSSKFLESDAMLDYLRSIEVEFPVQPRKSDFKGERPLVWASGFGRNLIAKSVKRCPAGTSPDRTNEAIGGPRFCVDKKGEAYAEPHPDGEEGWIYGPAPGKLPPYQRLASCPQGKEAYVTDFPRKGDLACRSISKP